MDLEEYKRKALEPIVNYIESVMASYSKEELEARIKKALPERESEDESIRKRLVEYFNGYYDRFSSRNNVKVHWEGLDVKAVIAWLEKQKEQKPAEWSEEDEFFRQQLIVYCKNCVQDTLAAKCVDWLKSLRSRPKSSDNWKPSEKQMSALKHFIGPSVNGAIVAERRKKRLGL